MRDTRRRLTDANTHANRAPWRLPRQELALRYNRSKLVRFPHCRSLERRTAPRNDKGCPPPCARPLTYQASAACAANGNGPELHELHRTAVPIVLGKESDAALVAMLSVKIPKRVAEQ